MQNTTREQINSKQKELCTYLLNHFMVFAAWSYGTLKTLTTFPAPSKASSAASSAYYPYFAPITLVTPFATPPPTA